MAGIQPEVAEMLKAMLGQQAFIVNKLEELEGNFDAKFTSMGARLDAMEQQQGTLTIDMGFLSQKMRDGIKELAESASRTSSPPTLVDLGGAKPMAAPQKLSDDLDWEALRWRMVEWEVIPFTSRERVIPFLSVEDLLNLDSAVAHKKLRKDLRKSYRNALIPALHSYLFTDAYDFKSLRRVMKEGFDLRTCRLAVRKETQSHMVLRTLIERKEKDIACYYAPRSNARDITRPFNGKQISTVTLAVVEGLHVDMTPVVSALIARGADVDDVDDSSKSPLNIAAHRGNMKMVKVLVEEGRASVNRISLGWTPLYSAGMGKGLEVTKYLISKGADVNLGTEKYGAGKSTNGKWSLYGCTPLHLASAWGMSKIAIELIDSGADLELADSFGKTALLAAVNGGHEGMVKLLLKCGADINVVNHQGETVVYLAISRDNGAMISTLINAGADINRTPKTNGDTPIHKAAKEGAVNAVKVLLDAGANTEITDFHGNRPLRVAKSPEIIRMLSAAEKQAPLLEREREKGAPSALTTATSAPNPCYSFYMGRLQAKDGVPVTFTCKFDKCQFSHRTRLTKDQEGAVRNWADSQPRKPSASK